MNQPIIIERGVPMPESRQYKYPFADLEVGDSFTIPLSGQISRHGEDLSSVRLRSAASAFGRKYGGRFLVRVNKTSGVVRCWKVE